MPQTGIPLGYWNLRLTWSNSHILDPITCQDQGASYAKHCRDQSETRQQQSTPVPDKFPFNTLAQQPEWSLASLSHFIAGSINVIRNRNKVSILGGVEFTPPPKERCSKEIDVNYKVAIDLWHRILIYSEDKKADYRIRQPTNLVCVTRTWNLNTYY